MEIVIPLNPDFSKAQTGSMELCALEKRTNVLLGPLIKIKGKKPNNFQLFIG